MDIAKENFIYSYSGEFELEIENPESYVKELIQSLSSCDLEIDKSSYNESINYFFEFDENKNYLWKNEKDYNNIKLKNIENLVKKYKPFELKKLQSKLKIKNISPRNISPMYICPEYLPFFKGRYKITNQLMDQDKLNFYKLKDFVWEEIDLKTFHNDILEIFNKEELIQENLYKSYTGDKKNKAILASFDKRYKYFNLFRSFKKYILWYFKDELQDNTFEEKYEDISNRVLLRNNLVYNIDTGVTDNIKENETFLFRSKRIVKTDLSECARAIDYIKEVVGDKYEDFMNWIGACFTSYHINKVVFITGLDKRFCFFDLIEIIMGHSFKKLDKDNFIYKKNSNYMDSSKNIYEDIRKGVTFSIINNMTARDKLYTFFTKILIKNGGLCFNVKSGQHKIRSHLKLAIIGEECPSIDHDSYPLEDRKIYYKFNKVITDEDYTRYNNLKFDESFLDELYTVCMHYAGKFLKDENMKIVGDK